MDADEKSNVGAVPPYQSTTGQAPVPARHSKVQMDRYIKMWRYLLFALWLVCVASSAGGEVRAIVKRVQIEGARSVSARDVRGW